MVRTPRGARAAIVVSGADRGGLLPDPGGQSSPDPRPRTPDSRLPGQIPVPEQLTRH